MEPLIRPRCYLDVQTGTTYAGRIVIELFAEQCPKTCENFVELCRGTHRLPPDIVSQAKLGALPSNSPLRDPKDPKLSYLYSPVHRILKEFLISFGDITAQNGRGGLSIYNHHTDLQAMTDGGIRPGLFDEPEAVGWRDWDVSYLVGVARRGPGTSGSQFFITLAPADHLKDVEPLFGRVVQGQEVLAKLATDIPLGDDDKPINPVLIVGCGELAWKGRKRSAPDEPGRVSPNNERAKKSARHDQHQDSTRADVRERRGQTRSSPIPSIGGFTPLRRAESSGSDEGEHEKRGRTLSRSPQPPARPRSRSREKDKYRRSRYSRSRSRSQSRSHSRDRENGNSHRRRRSWWHDRSRSPRRDWPQRSEQHESYHSQGGHSGGHRRRENEFREKTEVEVEFKGRGTMKFRESGGNFGVNSFGRLL